MAVLVGLGSVGACSTSGAEDAVLRKLAQGTWSCEPEVEDMNSVPFDITIEEGTFVMAFDFGPPDDDADPGFNELHGSWSIDDGDLTWSYDAMDDDRGVGIEGFSELTTESDSFTVTDPSAAGTERPRRFEVLAEVHGTDSVTFRVPDGDPWTCDRQ